MSETTGSHSRGQRIFISYRRNDCLSQANGLHDGLMNRLPGAQIFMDVDSIPAGVDFEEYIRAAIDKCDVVLVLIGDNWLDTRADTSTRRIDEQNDFVRLEVESALANPSVTTIPVLVEGAQMPEAATLPESIQRLARINAFELDDRRWKADLSRITELLEGLQRKPSGFQPQKGQPAQSPTYTSSLPQSPTYQPPQAPAYGGPQTTVGAVPSKSSAAGNTTAGIVAALSPLVCCGLLNIVPLLRSGLIRPSQRWKLIGTGLILETAAIVGFGLIGTAPTDADETPTGVAATVAVVLILISMVIAVVLGFLFREPEESEPQR